MNILFLYSRLSAHSYSMINDVALNPTVKKVVCLYRDDYNYFDLRKLNEGSVIFLHDKDIQADIFDHYFNGEAPNIIYVSGWSNKKYVYHLALWRFKNLLNSTKVVCGIDDQWKGSAKQWIGRQFRFVIGWLYDIAWVAGSRQYYYSKMMGFKLSIPFLLSGSSKIFKYTDKHANRFIFIGRDDPVKGLELLMEAFTIFNQSFSDYELIIIGPDGSNISEKYTKKCNNIFYRGFLTSENIQKELLLGGVGVIPSTKEQWGVVIHEFCLAGLPVIATKECGASEDLVINKMNGFVVETGSIEGLVNAMKNLAEMNNDEIFRLKGNSAILGSRYSSTLTVNSLISCVKKK
jgi:glycosyltransferase involved in cell wall biosynthesis